MSDEDEFDQTLALDDERAVLALAPFYDWRPARQAWRADPDAAPADEPIYAREPDSLRVLIAMRDEEGWVSITRDGEVLPLPVIGSWAPLAAVLG